MPAFFIAQMVKSSRRGRFGLFVNVLLVPMAFGLLSLVVWQNRDKIRAVTLADFGRRKTAGSAG